MPTRTSRVTRKASFAVSTLILALATVLSKTLGAVYRIPLTNILGAEGIGLYQLVFPIYALLITLSSGAIPTALARIISSRLEFDNSATIARAHMASRRLLLLLGVIFSSILLLLATPIALLQGDSDLKYCYFAIAPAIFIVALSNCYKGYFQGKLDLFPTALSQVIEQLIKLISGLILAKALISRGTLVAVIGAIIGVVIAEMVSLIVLAILYLTSDHDRTRLRGKVDFGYYRILIRVTLPILLSILFFPIIQFADSLLIVNILQTKGLTMSLATSEYGLLSGSVMTLVNMPIVIILSIATTIVPYIARRKSARDCPSIASSATRAVNLANMLAIPCAVGLFLLSDSIINVLYPSLSPDNRALATLLMRIASVSIPLLSAMQIFGALLQGLGRGKAVAYNMTLGAIVKIALDILLIYFFGIRGALYASIIAYAIIMIINIFNYHRLLGGQGGMLRPTIATAINATIMAGVIILTMSSPVHNITTLAIGVIIGVAMYAFLTLFTLNQRKNTPRQLF